MKAIVLLNGEPFRGKIGAEDAYVICCDGAYEWAKGKVRIDETIGDFDSLGYLPDPLPSKIYPAEKDETDGELAIDRAIELGAEKIDIFGGGGKREDHFLGNLHLLYKAKQAGVGCAALKTNGAELILAGEGENRFPCRKKQTVSLLPFGGDAHIMEMQGFRYSERDLWLRCGSTRGISNLTLCDGYFSFRVAEGYVLVIINQEEI